MASVLYDRDSLPRHPRIGWGATEWNRKVVDQYEVGLRVVYDIDAENSGDDIDRYVAVVGRYYMGVTR